LLVLAEQFSGGNGLLATWAQPAVAEELAGPVAVVAPLVGEVALVAFPALVDGRLAARRAVWRRDGNGCGLAGAERLLLAGRGAVALPANGGELGGADRAAGGGCRHVVVTRRARRAALLRWLIVGGWRLVR
jgi:hypothetical protein